MHIWIHVFIPFFMANMCKKISILIFLNHTSTPHFIIIYINYNLEALWEACLAEITTSCWQVCFLFALRNSFSATSPFSLFQYSLSLSLPPSRHVYAHHLCFLHFLSFVLFCLFFFFISHYPFYLHFPLNLNQSLIGVESDVCIN